MAGKKKAEAENGKKLDSRTLEKRLSSVRDTAEDIQSVSRWCLQNKSQHHSIVQAWARALRKSKVSHRLTLFYVCNDIIQNARRKKVTALVQHFFTAIKEAAPLVRDSKIQTKVLRVFAIWEERGIYDSKLVKELTEIVKNVGTANTSENEIVLSSFQPSQLLESLRTVLALEKTAESLLGDLCSQEFNFSDQELDSLSLSIKEKIPSADKIQDFDEAMTSLECYATTLQKQIDERTKVITLLEQAEIFYTAQHGEAKLVASAYKNFGGRVKSMKNKLVEKMKTLPSKEEDSPLPTSPPSPSTVPSPIPSPVEEASPSADESPLDASKEDSGNFESFMNSSSFATLSSHPTDLDSRLASLGASSHLPHIASALNTSTLSSEADSSFAHSPASSGASPLKSSSVTQTYSPTPKSLASSESYPAPVEADFSGKEILRSSSSALQSVSSAERVTKHVSPESHKALDYSDEISMLVADDEKFRSRKRFSESSSREHTRDSSKNSSSREYSSRDYSSSSRDHHKDYSSSSREHKDCVSSKDYNGSSSRNDGSGSSKSDSSSSRDRAREYSSSSYHSESGSGSRDHASSRESGSGSRESGSRDHASSRSDYSSSSRTDQSNSHSREHGSSRDHRSASSSRSGEYEPHKDSSYRSSSYKENNGAYKEKSSNYKESDSYKEKSSDRKESSSGSYKESSSLRERSSSRSSRDGEKYSKDIIKDLKPMSAAELLDAFSKELAAKSNPSTSSLLPSSTVTSSTASKASPSVVPLPVLPPLCPPPSFSSIPIPPSPQSSLASPSTVPPSSARAVPPPPLPNALPSAFLRAPLPPCPPPPLPDNPPPPSSVSEPPLPPASHQNSDSPSRLRKHSSGQPSNVPPLPPPSHSTAFPHYNPKSPWDAAALQPPPPPPPPPQISEYCQPFPSFKEEPIPSSSGHFESYYEFDDGNDNINWMEPPGNEELAAISQASEETSQDTHLVGPASSASVQSKKPNMTNLHTLLGNLKEIVSNRKKKSSATNNLRVISTAQDQPSKGQGVDEGYQCYDYRSLSDHKDSNAVPKPNNSGSDMDISGSEDELAGGKHHSRKRRHIESKNKSEQSPKRGKPDLSDESSNDSYSSTISMASNKPNPNLDLSASEANHHSIDDVGANESNQSSAAFDGNTSTNSDLYSDINKQKPSDSFSDIKIASGDLNNITNAIKILISGERRKTEIPDARDYELSGMGANSADGMEYNNGDPIPNNGDPIPDNGEPISAIKPLPVTQRLGSPVHNHEPPPDISLMMHTPPHLDHPPSSSPILHPQQGEQRPPLMGRPPGDAFGMQPSTPVRPERGTPFRPRGPRWPRGTPPPNRFNNGSFIENSPYTSSPPMAGPRGGVPFRMRGGLPNNRGGRGGPFRGSPFRGPRFGFRGPPHNWPGRGGRH